MVFFNIPSQRTCIYIKIQLVEKSDPFLPGRNRNSLLMFQLVWIKIIFLKLVLYTNQKIVFVL